MKKTIQDFKEKTEEQFRKEYVQTVVSNLSDLNKEESKTIILMATTILIYFLVITGAISKINLGFVDVDKMEILIAYTPIIFLYLMFKSYSITFQIKESKAVLDELLENELLLDQSEEPDLKSTRFSRAFYPYSFSTQAGSVLKNSPNILMTIIGFILMLPVMTIGLLPYGIIALMLYESHKIIDVNIFTKIGYIGTWWATGLLVFYVIMNGMKK